MIWRLAYPFLLLFGPVILPRLVRTVYAVWKLSMDKRVNFLLRLLIPATLIYFLTPFFPAPPDWVRRLLRCVGGCRLHAAEHSSSGGR